MSAQIAIFPGTFDPITLGHLNLIQRSAKLFNKLIIAVGENPKKKTLFSLSERIDCIKQAIADYDNETEILVLSYSDLLVDFAKSQQAVVIIRGIRTFQDFEYEKQLSQINQHLDNQIETFFLNASDKFHFVSSSMVKELVTYLKDDRIDQLKPFVPDFIAKLLMNKLHPKE